MINDAANMDREPPIDRTRARSILSEAVAAAEGAGELIAKSLADGSLEVRAKLGTEIVTTADLRSDEHIRAALGARFPEHRTAIRGSGALCNGRPIRVSGVMELSRALVGTGFPHDRSDLAVPLHRIARLLSECQDIRRAGSPALDICWVAAGRMDAHCESLAPWDIAAAGLIATEAGAVRGNLRPGDPHVPEALRSEEFIVATPGIFEQLCRLLGDGEHA